MSARLAQLRFGGLVVAIAALGGLALLALLVRTDGGHDETGGATEAQTCPSRPAPQFDERGDLTFEQIAERAKESATCPGYVLHLRSVVESDLGPYSVQGETDIWVDLTNNLGRADTTFTSEDAQQYYEDQGLPAYHPEIRRAVYVGDVEYARQHYGDEQSQFDRSDHDSCHGDEGPILELVIGCEWSQEGPLQKFTFTIEQETTYRGRPALALVRSPTSRGSDTRLYVDRVTFLPLGTNAFLPVRADIPIDHTFVKIDTLPDNLFDPASLGYVIDNFEQEIRDADLDLAAYWLDREFTCEGGTPTLVLDSIFIFGSAEPALAHGMLPQPILRFNYRAVNEEADAFAVTLRLYPKAIWEAHDPDAAGEREIQLPEGRAVIYAYGTDPPSGLTYSASASFGDAVIYVRAPLQWNEQRTPADTRYDSQAAIENIIRNLKRFE